MDKVSTILSAVLVLSLAALWAPRIVAMNRGKVLRNIALWLAIVAGLGLVYQLTHSGRPMTMQMFMPWQAQPPPEAAPPVSDKNSGSKGFTPPGE